MGEGTVKNTTIIIAAFIISVVLLLLMAPWILEGTLWEKEASVADLIGSASYYDGRLVKVEGYVVENTGYYFGQRYMLYDVHYLISPEKVPSVGLVGEDRLFQPFVSYTFDGTEYKAGVTIRPVYVTGTFHYNKDVVDSTPFTIVVRNIVYSV